MAGKIEIAGGADLTPEMKEFLIAQTRMKANIEEMKALLDEQAQLAAILAGGGKGGISPVSDDELAALKADLANGPPEGTVFHRVDKPMKVKEVMAITGVTKRTLYRWMDSTDMEFPRPEIVRGVAEWDRLAVRRWWAAHQDKVGRWPREDDQ